MTDFTNAHVAYDPATGAGVLSGSAFGPITDPVHVRTEITAENGDTDVIESDATRTRQRTQSVKVTGVSDDLGGVYTIAADGSSYQLNA